MLCSMATAYGIVVTENAGGAIGDSTIQFPFENEPLNAIEPPIGEFENAHPRSLTVGLLVVTTSQYCSPATSVEFAEEVAVIT